MDIIENNSNFFLFLLFSFLIIIGSLYQSARKRKILSNKLEIFARQHGLTINISRKGITVEGTYFGRSLTIESFTRFREGWHFYVGTHRSNRKHTILRIKMSVNQLPDTYLKIQALPYLTLPFIFKKDGIYINLQDKQDPMNLVRILNVENDEVPPSALFDFQSDPKKLVKELLERHPSIKSNLVESFYSGTGNIIKSVEMKSGYIIVEQNCSSITKESLETISKTMNALAKDIERI